MNDNDLTIYRTTNPDVLQRWHDVNNAMDGWQKQVETALEEMGMGGRSIYYDQVTGRITGVAHNDGEDIPDGWRQDRRNGHLVPRGATKAGKAIGAELDALRRPDPRDLNGMPKHAFAVNGPAFLTCGVAFMDGALYVRWSKPISEEEIDLTIWERVKLSAYYAVVEANDEQQGEPLIDPDCRDGKCDSCIGGPCEHDCHKASA